MGDQFGDEALAAEEVGGVGRLEPGQALVGTAPEGGDDARLELGLSAGQLGAPLLEQPLDALDAVRDLAAGGDQAAAGDGHTVAGLGHEPTRPLPGPLAGLLVDQQRNTTGQLVDPAHVLGRPGFGGVQLADAPNRVARQRAEGELRRSTTGRFRCAGRCGGVAAERADDEHRGGPAPAGEIGHDLEGLGVGQMQVVEHDEHRTALRPGRQMACHRLGDVVWITRAAVDVSEGRAGALEGLAEQGAGTAVGVVTAPVEHRRTVVVDPPRQLGDQSGLADPLRSQYRHEAAAPVHRVRPRLPQPRQFGARGPRMRDPRRRARREARRVWPPAPGEARPATGPARGRPPRVGAARGRARCPARRSAAGGPAGRPPRRRADGPSGTGPR